MPPWAWPSTKTAFANRSQPETASAANLATGIFHIVDKPWPQSEVGCRPMRPAKYLATAVLFFAGVARAQAPAAPAANPLPFTLKPLGHNVWAALDDTKGDAGANAGFVIGDDGVAVIDTVENPDAAKQMLAEIGKITGLPVKFVIDTHYNIDHVA